MGALATRRDRVLLRTRRALRDGGAADATVAGVPMVVTDLAVRDGQLVGETRGWPSVALDGADDVPGDLRLVRAAGAGRELRVRVAGWWREAGGTVLLEPAFATVEVRDCPCEPAPRDGFALRLEDDDVVRLLLDDLG